MNSSDSFDQRLDQLLERERAAEPNPFMATRILSRIDREFSDQRATYTPVWLRIIQPVIVSLALVIGIVIGANLSSQQSNETTAISSESNIQQLKSDLFISEITRDDNVLPLNETQP
jgi:hypothetical protein